MYLISTLFMNYIYYAIILIKCTSYNDSSSSIITTIKNKIKFPKPFAIKQLNKILPILIPKDSNSYSHVNYQEKYSYLK